MSSSRRKFEQLSFPLIPHPFISIEMAKQAIEIDLKEYSEIKGEPVWDWIEDEWRALIAITPSGPLLLMGFKFKPVNL